MRSPACQHRRKTTVSTRPITRTSVGLSLPTTVCATPTRTTAIQWTPPWMTIRADSVRTKATACVYKLSLQSGGRRPLHLRLLSHFLETVMHVDWILHELKHVEIWPTRLEWWRERPYPKRLALISHHPCRHRTTHAPRWLTSSTNSANVTPLLVTCSDEDSSLPTHDRMGATSLRRRRPPKFCRHFHDVARWWSPRGTIRTHREHEVVMIISSTSDLILFYWKTKDSLRLIV